MHTTVLWSVIGHATQNKGSLYDEGSTCTGDGQPTVPAMGSVD